MSINSIIYLFCLSICLSFRLSFSSYLSITLSTHSIFTQSHVPGNLSRVSLCQLPVYLFIFIANLHPAASSFPSPFSSSSPLNVASVRTASFDSCVRNACWFEDGVSELRLEAVVHTVGLLHCGLGNWRRVLNKNTVCLFMCLYLFHFF